MLIFDSFTSRGRAEDFANAAEVRLIEADHDDTTVVVSDEKRDDIDPFPFELHPPIVYVPRYEDATEAELVAGVKLFGGRFAGT